MAMESFVLVGRVCLVLACGWVGLGGREKGGTGFADLATMDLGLTLADAGPSAVRQNKGGACINSGPSPHGTDADAEHIHHPPTLFAPTRRYSPHSLPAPVDCDAHRCQPDA